MDDGLPQVVSPPQAIQNPEDNSGGATTIYNPIRIMTSAVIGMITFSWVISS